MKKWCAIVSNFLTSGVGQAIALTSIIGIFLALTLTRIGSSSIWFDEGFSSILTTQSWGDIFSLTTADVHPPLYYWLLKVWTELFGHSDIALRSMSVVFGCFVLILAFVLVKKLRGPKTATLATFLLAISPMFVRYGIEARMYTLMATICLGATIMLIKAERSGRRRDYLAYGVLIAIGMWTHYFTAMVWLAHWVYRFITLARQHGKKVWRHFWSANWLYAHLLAVALFIPWIPSAIRQFSTLKAGYWIPEVSFGDLANYLTNYLFYTNASNTKNYMMLVGAAAIVSTIIIVRLAFKHTTGRSRQLLTLLTTLAICPVALLAIFSLPPMHSFFVDRYLLPSMFCTSLLTGVSLAVVWRKKLLKPVFTTFMTLVFITCSITGISSVYSVGNMNPYDNPCCNISAAKELMQVINQNDNGSHPIIASQPFLYFEFFNYASDQHPVYFDETSLMNPAFRYLGSVTVLHRDYTHRVIDVKKFAREHKGFWLVGKINSDDPNQAVTMDGNAEMKGFKAVKTVSFTDPLAHAPIYRATFYVAI